MVRRTRKFPSLSDLVQNSEHHHGRMWTALLVKPPDGFDFDIEHPVCQSYEIYFICESAIGRSYHIYTGKYPPTLSHEQRRKYDVDCI